MPIVGLKDRETLLKSLKFGRDVRGGGDSGQPYIKSALPGDGLGSDALNSLTRNSFGDFPIRGNTAVVIKTAEDTIRIGKFSTSFPQGLLFVTKQQGLQKSNPNIETGPGDGNGLLNTQFYDFTNTLKQVGVQGSGIHFPRSGDGVLQLQEEQNKYGYIVSHKDKDLNRLVLLKHQRDGILGIISPDEPRSSEAINEKIKLGIDTDNAGVMFKYKGGPGSVYGLGETLVKYSTTNTGAPINTFTAPGEAPKRDPFADNRNPKLDLSSNRPLDTNYRGWNNEIVYIKDAITEAQSSPIDYRTGPYTEAGSYVNLSSLGTGYYTPFIADVDIPGFTMFNGTEVKAQTLINPYGTLKEQTTTGDIRYDGKTDLKRREGFNNQFFSNTISYDKLTNQPRYLPPESVNGKPVPINIQDPVEEGDLPSFSTRVLDSQGRTTTGYYRREARIGAGGTGKPDDINLISLYSDTTNPFTGTNVYQNKARDLIKFGFEGICNDCPDTTKVHFRAFITSFSDNHNAEWSANRYAGRGENFYSYQGFDRNVQGSFLIAAQSRQEMKPLWQKLNYLVSTLYPDYHRDTGYMRGNLIKFTLGEYFYRTPGILTNINITIENDYSWEIKMRQREGVEEDKQMELPQICSVSYTFIPILDDLPKRGTKVPLIMTDKMHGIQNYLNDPALVEECLPAETPPPPPPPAEEPVVEIQRDFILNQIPSQTNNNFNNNALIAADRYMNDKKREVTMMLNKVNDLQEERLWNAYQANPTQVNADAYQNYVKKKNEEIRKLNANVAEQNKYAGYNQTDALLRQMHDSRMNELNNNDFSNLPEDQRNQMLKIQEKMRNLKSPYGKKTYNFTGDPTLDLEQFNNGN